MPDAFVLNRSSARSARSTPPPTPPRRRSQSGAIHHDRDHPGRQHGLRRQPQLGTVTPVSVATCAAGMPITVGRQSAAIAINPDSSTVYVTNGGSGTVTPISTATNTAGTPITVGSEPSRSRDHPGRQHGLRH